MASRHPERYTRFLERLRQARLDAGLTQEDVASRLGVRQNFVSKMETGERRIDPVELAELAELYGRAVGWFVEEGNTL